jgi:hypothetical protein
MQQYTADLMAASFIKHRNKNVNKNQGITEDEISIDVFM